ncbi:MAG TPA: hypothetical protein VN228_15260 [Pyrinomonadaceae bacterium]|nr:hypothetical protein [Pyrinomonadaceae bacterium]
MEQDEVIKHVRDQIASLEADIRVAEAESFKWAMRLSDLQRDLQAYKGVLAAEERRREEQAG